MNEKRKLEKLSLHCSEAHFKKVLNSIEFGSNPELPMVQGSLINDMIKRYGIPAKAWGYNGFYIGIESKKQVFLWKYDGVSLHFMGLANKVQEVAAA